jgi:hypothetical protein
MTESADQDLAGPARNHPAREGNALNWPAWQRSVLHVLRTELGDLVHHLGLKEVDWASWRVFYDQGRSPRSAVSRALERDL